MNIQPDDLPPDFASVLQSAANLGGQPTPAQPADIGAALPDDFAAQLAAEPAYSGQAQPAATPPASPDTTTAPPAAPAPQAPAQAAAAPSLEQMTAAIHGAESGGKETSRTSVDGARGGMQILPDTFTQYARPGEKIDNPADNAAVGQRIVADLWQKTGGDPARVAVGYFSGPGNIAPPDSPTPWIKDVKDGNGTSTSAYVAKVLGGTVASASPATAAPAASPATNPYGFIQELYKSGAATLGAQQKNISDYIAGQPAVWQKLADLQSQYAKAAAPTTADSIGDLFNNYAQLKSAALANKYASAGGVLTNSLPDSGDFIKGLQGAHASDVQQRQARVDLAKTALQTGSANALGAMQQQGTNVGLQGSLAAEMIKYGLETGKLTQTMVQQGMDAASKVEEAFQKAVPNPTSAATLRPYVLAATRDNPLDVAGNLQKMSKVIAAGQAGTLAGLNGEKIQIAPKEPNTPTNMTPPPGMLDDQGRPQIPVTLDTSTPQGKAEFDDLRSKKWTYSPPVPINNFSTGPGSTGEVAADTQKQALGNITAANNVVHHIDYLKDLAKTLSGGTGVLSDSPMSLAVQNAVKQATGSDPGNISARQFFQKELNNFATGEVMSTFRQTAGPGQKFTQREFQALKEGVVSGTMPLDTITAALDKYRYDAAREVDRSTTIGNAAYNAQQSKLPFNPIKEYGDFEKNNAYRPPALPEGWLNQGATTVPGSKVIGGVTYIPDGKGGWATTAQPGAQ